MLDWITFSNPIALWWVFLVIISACNISSWLITYVQFSRSNSSFQRTLLWLSATYVFVCAFRSILPRGDVQRICLFDTWFSNVLIGRAVATIAELCFVTQWSLVLYRFSNSLQMRRVQAIALTIVPLIMMAECCSWYAVVRTDYLGNTCEESIWALTYCLIALCLLSLWSQVKGFWRLVLSIFTIGCIFYVAFMITIDVPMYFHRWQSDLTQGKILLGFADGLRDLNTRWIVSHRWMDWENEIPWMTLYFSVAVWTSLGLCYFPMAQQKGAAVPIVH